MEPLPPGEIEPFEELFVRVRWNSEARKVREEKWKYYLFEKRPWSRTSVEGTAEMLFLLGITPNTAMVREQSRLFRVPSSGCISIFNNALTSKIGQNELGVAVGSRRNLSWSATKESLIGPSKESHLLRAYFEGKTLIDSLEPFKSKQIGGVKLEKSQLFRRLRGNVKRLEPKNKKELLMVWKDWRETFLCPQLKTFYSPLRLGNKLAIPLKQIGWQPPY